MNVSHAKIVELDSLTTEVVGYMKIASVRTVSHPVPETHTKHDHARTATDGNIELALHVHPAHPLNMKQRHVELEEFHHKTANVQNAQTRLAQTQTNTS